MTDEDVRRTMHRALRLLAILAIAGVALAWWKMGWQKRVLLAVGAAISASGLWEWTAADDRCDQPHGCWRRSAARWALVLVGFFLRLGVALVALYVSLKYLDGSVYALAAGLGWVWFALTIRGAEAGEVVDGLGRAASEAEGTNGLQDQF